MLDERCLGDHGWLGDLSEPTGRIYILRCLVKATTIL